MELTDNQRFELLKLEMGLLQTTLDKYDDLIFRNRSWFITLWMGTMALGLAKSQFLVLSSVFVAILFWSLEGMMRQRHWYKYVKRYRTIRKYLNENHDQETLSVYDLTNHYMDRNPASSKDKDEDNPVDKSVKNSFFKREPVIIYGGLATASILVFCLLNSGVIHLLE